MTAPVNGGWSPWGPYGRCSRTCGEGTKTRNRVCNNPAPAHGGLPCPEPAVESARCNVKACCKFFSIFQT